MFVSAETKQLQIRTKVCCVSQEKNQSLNSTVMALSSQVGSLQVREEELSSMLKLKVDHEVKVHLFSDNLPVC